MFRLVRTKENIILTDSRTMQFCLVPNHSRFSIVHFSNHIYQWYIFFPLLNQAISGINNSNCGNGISILQNNISDLRRHISDLLNNIPVLRNDIPDLRGSIPDLRRHNPVLRNDIPVWGGIFRTWGGIFRTCGKRISGTESLSGN